MKQLIIIGEGQTEQEFCKNVLQNYFFNQEINIHNPTIKKSKGGMVAWQVLKKQIENHLKSSRDVTVTTLIDFYGLKDKHCFPKWKESKAKVKINEKITFLEAAMHADISEPIRRRFIPYIQVYEFEALLFSDTAILENQFDKEEFLDHSYLKQTLQIPPEKINDGEKTAPSKRLKKIFKGYNKVLYNSLILQEIGIEKIIGKCPRFSHWIEKLENI